ncbi:peptidase family M13 [Ancylostoma ceylanicum]|uniref:Peptidase family M13 n=1 Tax=Ancylostoma ceylanicum TaxID=53326 RepID=A0A0D6M248_9BILA|nr:peptidase family M13 [Ancylostoma ceylanicum]
MRKELTEEFANIIHKNTWLNADQKNYIRIEGFEKLPFLMQEDIFRSIAQKEQFNLLNDTVDLDKKRQTDQAYKNAGAYYSGVVTPSLLRFPTYGVTFPRSYIYASLGFAIGHEIMHAFDNTGVYRDLQTNFSYWLGREFYIQYEEKIKCLINMYNDVKIPGYNGKMDGKFTLAENIADNEGVKLAFKVTSKWWLRKTSNRYTICIRELISQ